MVKVPFRKMAATDTCRFTTVLLAFLCCFAALLQVSSGGGKTLVLLDNAHIKETHSIFFKFLKGIILLLEIRCYYVLLYRL